MQTRYTGIGLTALYSLWPQWPGQQRQPDLPDNLRIDEGGVSITAAHPQERYLHTDHLGSIVAVTDNQGRVLERSSYDAWGKRRQLSGLDDQQFDDQGLGILPSLSTHHGFTGHEMLDDMTLVHMNGRIYDPIIARFISADPHIDGLYSTQGLNSYSYVHNNPLNATDPSGYFLKKLVKKLVGGVKKAVKSVFKAVMKPVGQVIRAMGPLAQPLVAIASLYICPGPAAASCFAGIMGGGSFAVAHANGAGFNQSLRIGALAGATAYAGAHAAYWIGSNASSAIANVGMHGIRGGVTTLVSGGDFRSGFLAGSFGAFGDVTEFTSSHFGAGLFGGIGAKLGGGNFAEGAVVAIVGHEFNERRHSFGKQIENGEWQPAGLLNTRGGPYNATIDSGGEILLRVRGNASLGNLSKHENKSGFLRFIESFLGGGGVADNFYFHVERDNIGINGKTMAGLHPVPPKPYYSTKQYHHLNFGGDSIYRWRVWIPGQNSTHDNSAGSYIQVYVRP